MTSIKNVKATGEVFIQPLNKNNVFTFFGNFLPSWTRIQPTKKNVNLFGSGSATLHEGVRFSMAVHWVPVEVKTCQDYENQYCLVVYHYQVGRNEGELVV